MTSGIGEPGVIGQYRRIVDGRIDEGLNVIVHQPQTLTGRRHIVALCVIAHLYGHIADDAAHDE